MAIWLCRAGKHGGYENKFLKITGFIAHGTIYLLVLNHFQRNWILIVT